MAQLLGCPESLKKIQPYLKIALEHDAKYPIISYWCRLYALQTALTMDKSSKEAKMFLIPLMDWLEKQKVALQSNEMIVNETAAQAHFENYAIKLFNLADGMDQQGHYNKNIVKLFFTAGLLMDVLNVFGDVSEEIVNSQKYAKWKATLIHSCLKSGITPTPGPSDTESGPIDFNPPNKDEQPSKFNFPPRPPPGTESVPIFNFSSREKNDEPPPNFSFTPAPLDTPTRYPVPKPNAKNSPISTTPIFIPSEVQTDVFEASKVNGRIQLSPAQITKAQKYCKFAASALTYDDVAESVANLQKALKLLTTGED